jgi:hypothetical protein
MGFEISNFKTLFSKYLEFKDGSKGKVGDLEKLSNF